MAVGWQIPGRDTSVIQGQFLSPEFIRYSVRFVAEEHGSITGVTDQSVIEGNPTTPVIPEPDDGYYFTGWTGDHTGTESPLVIDTIQSDMTVTAGFAQKTWTVRFISGENGRISGISEQHIPHGGSTSQVRAVASEGCNFTGWSGDYSGTSERLSIDNVISDMTIRAEFTTNTYTVRFLAGNNGTINGETTQVIRHGSRTLPVTPVADNGYHFTSWSGNYTGQEFSLTIDPVTSDMTITAEFDINSYTVQFVAGDHGSISGQLRQTIIHGGRCTPVKAIPLPDCAFRGWTGGIKSNDIELQVDNVTSDMMIHSQFSIESEETGCFISTLKP